MNDKLRNYIESLFEDAPKTKQAIELKEEILQNTMERFNDLIADGKSEEAAFNIAVAGIGDVSELLNTLRNSPTTFGGYTREEIENDKKRSAIFVSAAVMLYILSVVPCILLSTSEYIATLGPCLMFIMIAVATGLLIFNSKVRISYKKDDDTIVEDFKKWSSESKERNSLQKSICSAMWAITLAIYFIISFSTGKWFITWIIFLIAGAAEKIVKACFEIKKQK